MRLRGRTLLELEPAEVELLTLLFDELTALLDEPDPADPALQRLNPAAYRDDAEAEAEYRSLTADGLHTERHERLANCRSDLAGRSPIDLADEDVARRWLQALNDLRLALGTRLGITQDEQPDVDPDDPAAHPWIVYSWLTALQDAVIHTLLP